MTRYGACGCGGSDLPKEVKELFKPALKQVTNGDMLIDWVPPTKRRVSKWQ